MFADRLKKSLLQAAIQGQLTKQLPTDGDARDLLKKIRAEKTKLITAKKIKAEKPLPTVTDDEIPFDIPESWCWVRLGDVCQINPRNKLKDENIDATFLPMTAINEGYSNGYNPLVKSWNEIRSGFTHFACGYLDKWSHPKIRLEKGKPFTTRRIIIPTADKAHYLAALPLSDHNNTDKFY